MANDAGDATDGVASDDQDSGHREADAVPDGVRGQDAKTNHGICLGIGFGADAPPVGVVAASEGRTGPRRLNSAAPRG